MLCKDLTIPFTAKFSKIPDKFFTILFYSINISLFFGCMNLFNIQGIFVLISILLMLAFVFLKRKIRINLPFILSIVFAISYSVSVLIFEKEYFKSALFYSFLIPIFIQYFETYEDKKKLLLVGLIASIGGLFAAFILIVISSYWHQGPSLKGDVLNDIYKGQTISRTGISLYVIGLVGVILATLFFKNKFRTYYTIPLLLIALFICSFVPISVGNRSYLIALFLVLFALFAFLIFSPRHGKIWTGVLIGYTVVMLSLLMVYYFQEKGIIHLPDFLINIKIISRIINGDMSSGRFELWKEFFSKFYKYPFGGLTNNMSNKYTHNIFLDFYAFGGFIPFLLFITFTVFLLIYLSHFLKLDSHSFYEKLLIIGIMSGLYALGMVEPIYIANQNSLLPLIFIFAYLRYCKINEPLPPRQKKPKKEKRIKLEIGEIKND